jgi:hypothetical protein
MFSGMVFDGRKNLEPASLVERGRLEGKRHQHDLRATAPSCLLLGRLEQLRTESPATLRLVDPELTHLTGAAPGVPADSSHDALSLAHKERKVLAGAYASGTRVELVDPIFQVLHFVWRRVDRTQRDFGHFHSTPFDDPASLPGCIK